MSRLLPTIESPEILRTFSDEQIDQLIVEIREELCQPLLSRSVHFASNLGVVELCIALHQVFDFRSDRLIWDTGHQVYPHKLVTGRFPQFQTIRTKGGLMGFPNPLESEFDLFMTGHAGCSVSTALGLKVGDELVGRPDTKSIAVIGDGAFPSGIVYEALNNAAGLNKDLIIVLNDNEMSICPRVGGVAKTLDKARMGPLFNDVKRNIDEILPKLPLVGGSADRMWTALKDIVKSNVFGGMMFEELGCHYIGPIDGHNVKTLREYLKRAKEMGGPVLLHVLTQKGHGIESASKDPVTFHTPPVFEKIECGVISLKGQSKTRAFTDVVSESIGKQMRANDKVACITAAMCQGNKLQKVREEFPTRFFDVGICEEHAVAFAAGLAKSGMRPIVDIYSTFLQRAYDQIFQEVSLQNLPVTFCLDRAGFTGPDGPTHHGNYDIGSNRVFPNMIMMAPGDENDVAPMLDFALKFDGPVSIRYPKATPHSIEREIVPIELGQSEVYEWGTDGCIIAFGSLFGEAVEAARKLGEMGYEIGVINARFAKPLDTNTILRAVEQMPWVITVEEGARVGGFGSAVLEAASDAGLSCANVVRLGVPDRYVFHAERSEQLEECGIDVKGIVNSALRMIEKTEVVASRSALESSKRVG